jgi:hypothetical protein
VARYDGRLHLEYVRPDPESGRWVTKTVAAQHDGASRTVALTTLYEEGDPGEPAVRWIRRDVVRLTSADEQRTMAEEAGLVVELIAGGYDLEPIGPHDERAIILARRPAGADADGAGRSRPAGRAGAVHGRPAGARPAPGRTGGARPAPVHPDEGPPGPGR